MFWDGKNAIMASLCYYRNTVNDTTSKQISSKNIREEIIQICSLIMLMNSTFQTVSNWNNTNVKKVYFHVLVPLICFYKFLT